MFHINDTAMHFCNTKEDEDAFGFWENHENNTFGLHPQSQSLSLDLEVMEKIGIVGASHA
jgi:hypothetical protein